MTTKGIIKILPFKEDFKTKLLERYDTMPVAEKYVLIDILWDAYDCLCQIKLEKNLQLARIDLENNKGTIDPEFFRRVEEKTEQEMDQMTEETTSQVDLTSTREKLEELMGKPTNN